MKTHQCLECGKVFSRLGHVKTHMLGHSGDKLHQCTECGKRFSQLGSMKTHMLVHSGEKPHECLECGKRFSRLGSMKTHILVHSGDKPHECPECGKRFSQLGSLKTHILVHSGDKPHECPECRKRFSHLGGMKTHMLVHSGVRPHECPECGKRFSHLGSMKIHLLVHSGDKPHECPECGKRFSQLGNMKTHILVHSGDKPHECPECGKKFSQLGSMKTHMLVHSGDKRHECPECGKRFIQLGDMKKHILVHSGNKSYECPECGKRFRRLGSVKTHRMVHADERPFECAECGKKFRERGAIIRHIHNQIPLSESAKRISAFGTPDGLYQYKILPFGMKNSGSCFQRAMNKMLQGMVGCTVYIDDIIVYSHSWDEHLRQLKELFDKLEEVNLVVNLPKSEFGKVKLQYLGYIVGQGEVVPVRRKVEAIDKYPVPRGRRDLLRYLGMVGYYRKFCRNFATIAAPLTGLLAKHKKWQWDEACQESFNKTKSLLTEAPVLVSPDFQKPFSLFVDASDVEAGAVLTQDQNGTCKPVSYFSRKFLPNQRAYSTIEKETLVLVMALQYFEVSVGAGIGPVTVFTEHNLRRISK
nr:gastrula zinc finger protein XlCGF57.1-like [Procambarus clarkii]